MFIFFNNLNIRSCSLINSLYFNCRDITTCKFPLYATGRENVHYVEFILELKKRYDFISMIFSLFMCKNLFKSPSDSDNLWL